MNLIICLDTKNGYSFAGRRQSKDKIQVQKMLETVGTAKLFLNEYSVNIFDNLPNNVVVSTNPLNDAEENDFCFVENLPIGNITFNKIVIYRWNRNYPSDKKFNQDLLIGKTLVSSVDFSGNSHEKITQEVYE